MHSVCPPSFAYTVVVKYPWEHADLPRAFHNGSLCKIWGANRMHYGEMENREFSCSFRDMPVNRPISINIKFNLKQKQNSFCQHSWCAVRHAFAGVRGTTGFRAWTDFISALYLPIGGYCQAIQHGLLFLCC